MTSNKHIAASRLKELRTQAETISADWRQTERFKEWQLSVDTALRVIFGNEGKYVVEFNKVQWSPAVLFSGQSSDVWERSFMSGLGRAKGLLNSAIQAAHDYELREDYDSRPEQTMEASPSLTSVVAGEVSKWPRGVRVGALCIAAVVVAIYFVWKSLPDDLKRYFVVRPPARVASEPPLLANTPSTWVYPNTPVMVLSNQVVVLVRSVSNDNETADFHLSIEPEAEWHVLKVGQQYRFRVHGRYYALTLLQVADPGARVEADAILIAPPT